MRKLAVWVVLSVMNAFPILALGRTAQESDKESKPAIALSPAYCNVAHNVGKLGMTVSNDGTIGQGLSVSGSSQDCFTGEALPRAEFPLGSETMYLYGGALWVGAVVGTDTLVSTGADGWSWGGREFHPDEVPLGNIIYRSTIDSRAPWYEDAVSEQDYIAVFRDTCHTCSGVSNDVMDNRPHIPLNLEVTQSSYVWSLEHAQDFVLLDYFIKNVGAVPLNEVYVGIYVDGDVHALEMNSSAGAQDDMTGLWTGTQPMGFEPDCSAEVGLDIAWIADVDGDLHQTAFTPVPHVTGLTLLAPAPDQTGESFNWWISNINHCRDYGPQMRVNLRDLGTGGLGTPEGDRNKYFLLRNGERDFDQVMITVLDPLDTVWVPPQDCPIIEGSLDIRYLLSVGPLTLDPGQSAPLTFAYVAGQNLHTDPANIQNLPDNPKAYLDGLDFSDLATNAAWAGWVYDNPGVDTDSDGYAGKYEMCGDDTVWYEGDGIPDFRATGPPVAPTFWLEPRPRGIRVRWNGFGSENEADWATRQVEFEGYRAYLSTSADPSDFVSLASYDVEDFYRYYWDAALLRWVCSPHRITIEEALCRYAPSGCDDVHWHPTDFTRQAPYVMPGYPDSILYFEPVLANAWRFGLETPFVKRFPETVKPPYERPSEVPPDSADFYLTPDGYFKYCEYEFLIERLLPEQPYWVTITAFESSSLVPEAIPPETEIAGNAKTATPLDGPCCYGVVGNTSCDALEQVSLLDVMVLVDYLFLGGPPLCCVSEADVDRSGGVTPIPADITLADIMALIDYLFITGPTNGTLPECP